MTPLPKSATCLAHPAPLSLSIRMNLHFVKRLVSSLDLKATKRSA